MNSWGYLPRGEISGSYGNSGFGGYTMTLLYILTTLGILFSSDSGYHDGHAVIAHFVLFCILLMFPVVEFKARLVYIVSSGTARGTQRNLIFKKKDR